MKNLMLLLLLLLLSVRYSSANKIDQLKTDSDVARFIVSLDSRFRAKYTQPFIVNSTEQIIKDKNCDGFVKKWGLKNWQKADFNNDGRTDLLVNGYWYNYSTYIAIDLGNDKFKLIILSCSPFEKCEVAKTIHSPYGQLVLFHTNKPDMSHSSDGIASSRYPETDTLIYKFDDFIDLNKSPGKYTIDSIKFHSGRCYGSCPDFDINIDKYGSAFYRAGFYSVKQGDFKGEIKADDLNMIMSLFDYVNVKNLKNSYDVGWTDSATCWLTIKFSDGSVKKIEDYGELGTFGLRRIYSLFFHLTSDISWVKN